MSATSSSDSLPAPRSVRGAWWAGGNSPAPSIREWRDRYGKANEHKVLIPRDHWLEQWERDAIIEFHHQFPLEGYRRLTFMMLDRDIVAVSPSSTYRVLKGAGLLDGWKPKPSLKGAGFVQPLAPPEHWHVDVS